jgi:hypothetical protein
MKLVTCLLVTIAPLLAQVKVTEKADRISVDINGKPFTEFFVSGPEVTKPYLHPLRAASGTIVTRAYPMSKVEGESTDHPHHRGLWFSHDDVNGIAFWLNEVTEPGDKKGKIVFKKADVKSGGENGSIRASFDWNGPDGKTVLTETRTMIFYADPTLRTMDIDIDLHALGEAVKFGDTKEGTFAIRLAAGLEEPAKNSLPSPKRTGLMVNSEGANGEKVGIAIFDNPANPKHPTYWHSRSYGLFAANPFGERDFYNDKSRDGSITIEPGKNLRFRYRVIIHPGDTASANIAGLWEKYSTAPATPAIDSRRK